MGSSIYIALEGLDATGKSSILRLLKKHLEGRGLKVLQIREPGSTVVGDKLRSILLDSKEDLAVETEVSLFLASRCDMLSKIDFDKYDVVLSDRSFFSTCAYQGRSFEDIEKIIDVHNYFLSRVPDVVLFLDENPADSLERLNRLSSKNGLDRIESKDNSYFYRVYENYKYLSKKKWVKPVKAVGNIKGTFNNCLREVLKYCYN